MLEKIINYLVIFILFFTLLMKANSNRASITTNREVITEIVQTIVKQHKRK